MKNKWIFGAVAVAACVYLLATIHISDVAHGRIMTDFRTFYFAMVGFEAGGNIYDFDYLDSLARSAGVTEKVFPYLYPPPMIFYLSPLAKLGVSRAALLWIVFSAVFSALILLQSMRLVLGLRQGATKKQERIFAVLAMVLFLVLPFRNNCTMGQVNIFVLFCIVTSLLEALVFKRDIVAGVLLAAATLVKITPLAILFYLVLNRRYRTLWGFAAGLILLLLPTFLGSRQLHTWQNFTDFAGNIFYGQKVPGLFPAGKVPNFAVAGCIARVTEDERIIKVLTMIVLVILGVGLLIAHAMTDKKNRSALLLCYLILMAIASPLTYLHHVIYIYPGLLLTAWLTMAGGDRIRWVWLALIFLLAVISGTDCPNIYVRLQIQWQAIMSFNLFALLVLFALGLLLPQLAGAPGGEPDVHFSKPR